MKKIFFILPLVVVMSVEATAPVLINRRMGKAQVDEMQANDLKQIISREKPTAVEFNLIRSMKGHQEKYAVQIVWRGPPLRVNPGKTLEIRLGHRHYMLKSKMGSERSGDRTTVFYERVPPAVVENIFYVRNPSFTLYTTRGMIWGALEENNVAAMESFLFRIDSAVFKIVRMKSFEN